MFSGTDGKKNKKFQRECNSVKPNLKSPCYLHSKLNKAKYFPSIRHCHSVTVLSRRLKKLSANKRSRFANRMYKNPVNGRQITPTP